MNKIQEVMQKFRAGPDAEKTGGAAPVGPGLATPLAALGGGGGDTPAEHRDDANPDHHTASASSTGVTATSASTPAATTTTPAASTSAPSSTGTTLGGFRLIDGSRMTGGDGEASGGAGAEARAPLEKRMSNKPKPKGTFEYIVQDRDTLVKIGAHFDVTPSELMKVNKMMSRNVFAGQTLFIPDPDYVPSDPPSPVAQSPAPDSSPRHAAEQRVEMKVPGHAVQVTPGVVAGTETPAAGATGGGGLQGRLRQVSQEEMDEADRECLKRFLKMPVRRFLEQQGDQGSLPCAGTLLMTPNALMFDPDPSDPAVASGSDQYQLVIYMEDLKSVAIASNYAHKPREEVESERQASISPAAASGDQEVKVAGSGSEDSSPEDKATGRTSEELEKMEEDMAGRVPDTTAQPGRTSEEIEHAMMSASSATASPSMLLQQLSRSSEAASCEISQLGAASDLVGETRDFGAHMGRSSSECRSQLTSVSSPGAPSPGLPPLPGSNNNSSSGRGGGEIGSTGISTPTQGFALVHFTDKTPPCSNDSVIAHPTPVVSGQQRGGGSGGGGGGGALFQPVVAPSSSSLSAPLPLPPAASLSQQPQQQQQQQLILSPSSLVGLTDPQRLPFSTDPEPVTAGQENPAQTSSAPSSSLARHDASTTSTAAAAAATMAATTTTTTTGGGGGRTSSFLESAVSALTFSSSSSSSPQHQQTSETATTTTTTTSEASGSLMSSFSPSQQISNFFQFTSNFIRGAAAADKKPAADSTDQAPHRLLINSAREQMGLTSYLNHQRGDAASLSDKPYYLQLKPRKACGQGEGATSKASDQQGYLDEYWFSVPRGMTTRLYNFLVTWQPEAYGEEGEVPQHEPREKFFYDQREVRRLTQAAGAGDTVSLTSADGVQIQLAEDHFSEQESPWVIIHRDEVTLPEPVCEEVGRPAAGELTKTTTEDSESLDEAANMPELVGGTSVILNDQRLRDLYKAVPRQVSVGYNYELVYATHRDGFSLLNLYGKMAECPEGPVWLLIRDNHQCVFGAYLSENIKESKNFYGSGYTFLFSWYPTFNHFHWQGDNDFYMNGQREYFTVGAGDGQFGLYIDGDLYRGRSQACTTFHNSVLTKKEDFCVVDLEVWRFTDLM